MSYDFRMAAMEGMFDPEQTAAKMLDAVKINVEKTVNTVDAASSLENKLSEEAAQFNACLTTMANSIRKCERGEISREEMLAECAPCASMLKEKCTALQLGNVSTSGDDITEGEIAMLSEYITGCKDIVAARKLELQDDPTATESYGILEMLSDPAMEGIFDPSMKKSFRESPESKTARELHKQAKKLYSMGSKEKAVEYMQKAKKLYEECLKTVQKNAKMLTVERTVTEFNVKDTFKKRITENRSMWEIMLYFEDRIDSCKAYLLQWANKAGNKDYQETKAQLKAERKAEHARIKAEKREARAAAKAAKRNGGAEPGTEAYAEYLYDFEEACESYMDSLELELATEAAMEAEGEEGSEGGQAASGIGAKLRAAFGKLRRGDKSAGAEAVAAAEELEAAADEAETPEEKKKLGTAAKVGMAAAAVAATAAGMYALGKKFDKTAKQDGAPDPKAVAKALRAFANRSDKIAGDAKKFASGTVEKIKDKRLGDKAVKAGKVQDAASKPRFRDRFKKKATESYSDDAILGAMAFGLEGFTCDDEDCETEPMEGKGFDDDDMIEDAVEGCESEDELDDLATEAAVAVMLAEDGITD